MVLSGGEFWLQGLPVTLICCVLNSLLVRWKQGRQFLFAAD
jgi:hypothetical protein